MRVFNMMDAQAIRKIENHRFFTEGAPPPPRPALRVRGRLVHLHSTFLS